MEFDEYEYLEKTVEEQEALEELKKSKKLKTGDDDSNHKTERSYRKRDGDDGDSKSIENEKEGSGKDRARNRDRDRDRDRERSSRDKERHRDRYREKVRDRERSGTDKDRELEKDSDRRERRDKEKERERERKSPVRSRSGSRPKRSRSRSSSRPRKREIERVVVRDREREPDIDMRETSGRKFKDKRDEPEADPERDQRTVFAYQMPLKATERHVYEFFSKAGKVRDVRLIMDRNSRRSKGVGYIEFYDAMSVPMAIALSGQLLLGQPVMVKPSEAEKNLVQSNASVGTGGATGPYGAVDRKLYVGNLHFNMTEMQLRQIFEPFGTVELVQLPLDLETGQCKGFGFVQFAHLEHAKAAQSALNGKLEIAGRTIKVSSVTDHVGAQDIAAKTADFDDDDGGGLALNAQSRAMLMAKLDRSGIATSITGSLGVPGLNGSSAAQLVGLPVNGQATVPLPTLPGQVFPSVSEPIGLPSECLLLKNLFDPSTETEPDFDLDIKEDVEEECSRYGAVKHIYVDKNSAGNVYLRFESVDGASKAQQAMHMRWFAQRLISAIYLQPYEYDAKFKNAI